MQREREAISGSQIVTATPTPERDVGEASGSSQPGAAQATSEAPVLKLRLMAGDRNKPRVIWDESVVDNEHLGRKSSKICCIYHKPRAFGESSSDSSSSSSSSDSDSDSPASNPDKPNNDLLRGIGPGGRGVYPRGAKGKGKASDESQASSDSDGGAGDGNARPARTTRRPPPLDLHTHGEGEPSCTHDHSSHAHGKKKSRTKYKPNAYEIDPMEKKRKRELKKARKQEVREGKAQQQETSAVHPSEDPQPDRPTDGTV